MKLAISNIAWSRESEPDVAALLRDMDLTGVEVAPTKIWSTPLETGSRDILRYREFWERHGIRIVALQALLFGRGDLTIFGSAATRAATLDYLSAIIRLGGRLGAEALVFGSPKNRQVGTLSASEIEHIAVPFFRTAGDAALEANTVLCIEPNPREYGCDFITTSSDAVALTQQVNSPGFRVHLDAGAMTMAGEHIEPAVTHALPLVNHFHVSEANLDPIGGGGTDHRRFGRVLAEHNYDRWISIEMRPPATGIRGVQQALIHTREAYAALLSKDRP